MTSCHRRALATDVVRRQFDPTAPAVPDRPRHVPPGPARPVGHRRGAAARRRRRGAPARVQPGPLTPTLGGVPRVTLKTVADRVGVSAMTVSNAFSRPDQLSAALRERILAGAAELGYVGPDPAARTLARGRHRHGRDPAHRVAAATPSTDEYTTAFLAAITEELARRGPGAHAAAQRPGRRVVPARDVAMDGAIVYSCRPGATASTGCAGGGCRWCSSTSRPRPAHTAINVDDRAAAARGRATSSSSGTGGSRWSPSAAR